MTAAVQRWRWVRLSWAQPAARLLLLRSGIFAFARRVFAGIAGFLAGFSAVFLFEHCLLATSDHFCCNYVNDYSKLMGVFAI